MGVLRAGVAAAHAGHRHAAELHDRHEDLRDGGRDQDALRRAARAVAVGGDLRQAFFLL